MYCSHALYLKRLGCFLFPPHANTPAAVVKRGLIQFPFANSIQQFINSNRKSTITWYKTCDMCANLANVIIKRPQFALHFVDIFNFLIPVLFLAGKRPGKNRPSYYLVTCIIRSNSRDYFFFLAFR
jgi:hypothetical protein